MISANNRVMHNTRVLVIDDEEIVRDSIREILTPKEDDHSSSLADAALDLFDEIEPIVADQLHRFHPIFEFDETNNGKSGLEKVKKAIQEEFPYAVIFCDMRMPGWDGLQTCVEIRKVDPKVQIFFVTAFTDHSVEEIVKQAGGDVGYLSKPFIHEEIIQIATKGVYDWHRLTSLERLLEIIGQIGVGNSQLKTLLVNIFHQISDYIGTEYALLGRIVEEKEFEEIARIGLGKNRLHIDKLLEKVKSSSLTNIEMIEGVLVCQIESYYVLVVPDNGEWFNQEKAYLLHLFIENAVRAIKNAELNEKLIQQEKLSAVGQAIGMVMHDIKNPIGGIQSTVELIQEDLEDPEQILELSEMIYDATEQAMEIVSDVRDFIRNAKLNLEKVDLSTYLNDIIQEVHHNRKSSQVNIRLETPPELLGSVDPKKMKRVVINLVNNAIEAMESSGTDEPTVWVKGQKMEDMISLSIIDNGPGIPPSIQDDLFEPFVTEGKATGTGLGLAIVKQIIEAHEGNIAVNSTRAGSTFEITLPV